MIQPITFLPASDPDLVGAWALRASDPVTTRWWEPGADAPLADEIVLWTGRVSVADEIAAVEAAGFSKAERSRLARFTHQSSRQGYLAAHALARIALGAMLGRAAGDLVFSYGAHGKPALADGALEFNLSHKDDIAALAVARAPVGVDIEKLAWREDYAKIARRQYAPPAAMLGHAVGTDRATFFFRHWTLGEALIKATGQGLSQDTSAFCFNDQGPPVLQWIEPEYGPVYDWRFGTFRPSDHV